MSINIYSIMKPAEEDRDEFDVLYPDIMTLAINNFRTNYSPETYTLTAGDIDRLDILCSSYYGISDYTNILLWYNNISWHDDLEVGQEILLPDIRDITTFYTTYAI